MRATDGSDCDSDAFLEEELEEFGLSIYSGMSARGYVEFDWDLEGGAGGG